MKKKLVKLLALASVAIPSGICGAATPVPTESIVDTDTTTAPIGKRETEFLPAPSVVITETGIGYPSSDLAMNLVQAKLVARRAAMVDAINKACREAGAAKGRVKDIHSEDYDGEKYIMVANIQVWGEKAPE